MSTHQFRLHPNSPVDEGRDPPAEPTRDNVLVKKNKYRERRINAGGVGQKRKRRGESPRVSFTPPPGCSPYLVA